MLSSVAGTLRKLGMALQDVGTVSFVGVRIQSVIKMIESLSSPKLDDAARHSLLPSAVHRLYRLAKPHIATWR